MVGGKHVGVLDVTGIGFEGVGRHVDFTLADQRPVEALGRTVVKTVFVNRHGAVGADHRLIVPVARQLPHTPGGRAVAPGLPRVGEEVIGLLRNTHHTVVAHRLQGGVPAHGLYLAFGFWLDGR
ncbi:hypothetical protein D3C79_930340 [compost metagenome]